MPRLRKIVPHNSVFFVTSSIQEGLHLTANPLISLIVTSCLARANRLHPVKIIDYIIQATHVHFILVVHNPDDLKGFMERFKTESATALNRLLNRTQRSLWCSGYDSTVILDPEKVVEKTAYLYANPSNDNLVDTIEQFPGMNSWGHLTSAKKSTIINTKLLPRRVFTPLPKSPLSTQKYSAIAQQMSQNNEAITLTLHGIHEWLALFDITTPELIEQYRDAIVAAVREQEQQNRVHREEQKLSLLGRSTLISQKPGTPYTPKRKKSYRTYCISSLSELRVEFIHIVKDLVKRAQDVYKRWKHGDYSIEFPLGLYPPAKPRIALPIIW